MAEELQAHGSNVLRHTVQYPPCRSDDAVAPFLLHTGQAAQELVGDIFAQSCLTKLPALDSNTLGTQRPSFLRRLISIFPDKFERCYVNLVDLAAVVSASRDLEPIPLGVDHAPP